MSLFDTIYELDIQRREKLESSGGNLAYYTDAATAISIIRNKNIWMRNARMMNDWSEVSYATSVIFKLLNNNIFRDKLSKSLCGFHRNLEAILLDTINTHATNAQFNTYLVCLTEHDKHNEDDLLGRLSMWRAYGRDCPVALVVNRDAVLNNDVEIEPAIYPVEYLNHEEIEEKLFDLIDTIRKHQNAISIDQLKRTADDIFKAIFVSMISTKNKGFNEEKEWRLVLNRSIWVSNDGTLETPSSIEIINGEPQEIYKLSIENIPQTDASPLMFDDILKHVLIGPSNNGATVASAFVKELQQAGVSNAERRVMVSGIPLRP